MASTTDHKHLATGYPAPSQPTSGTAYPYAAAPPYYPPPPPPPQPYYNNPISPARRFFRFIIIACIVFFLVSGVIILITWIVLRPQVPTFSVSSASVSGLNVSASSKLLSGDFDFTLDVGNPNKKMSVDYKSVRAVVGYGHDSISETSLPPFGQEKRNVTVVRAKFAPRDQYLTRDSADRILKEKAGGGNGDGVRFRLDVLARATFRAGGWTARTRRIRVYCNDVRIGFGNATTPSSSGSMVGPGKRCRVNL